MQDLSGAVIIDDDSGDVFAVSKALGKRGVASYPIHFEEPAEAYDMCREIAKAKPRIIITDIQIVQSQSIEATVNDFANVTMCIELITKDIDGPYFVLVWSDKQESFEALKKYIDDNIGSTRPASYGAISKDHCKKNGVEYCPDLIFDAFYQYMDLDKQVRALLHWERRIFLAAHSVTNQVISAADGKLGSTLLTLALGVAGGHLDGYESEAISESLLFILRDEIGKISSYPKTKDIWKRAIEKQVASDSEITKSKLNTLLHLDFNVDNGIVCPGDVWVVEDEIVFFKNRIFIGDEYEAKIEEFLHEFINLGAKERANYEETMEKSKPSNIEKMKETVKTRYIDPENKVKAMRKIIALEISPSCDFSNIGKKSLKTLVLGVLIEKDCFSKVVKIQAHESLVKINILVDGCICYFVFSAKYIFSFSESMILSDDLRLKKKWRIRESLLQSWIQEFSSYNARIGTTTYSL